MKNNECKVKVVLDGLDEITAKVDALREKLAAVKEQSAEIEKQISELELTVKIPEDTDNDDRCVSGAFFNEKIDGKDYTVCRKTCVTKNGTYYNVVEKKPVKYKTIATDFML